MRWQHLERHNAVGLGVVGPIALTHTASADQLLQLIVPEWRRIHRLLLGTSTPNRCADRNYIMFASNVATYGDVVHPALACGAVWRAGGRAVSTTADLRAIQAPFYCEVTRSASLPCGRAPRPARCSAGRPPPPRLCAPGLIPPNRSS